MKLIGIILILLGIIKLTFIIEKKNRFSIYPEYDYIKEIISSEELQELKKVLQSMEK